jgi:pyruvate dehydrogenase (quinone)
MTTIAEQLVEILVQADVRRINGVVGDSFDPVADAVRRSPVDRVYVRNQEAGAFAAAAGGPSARVDGRGGVGTMSKLPRSNLRSLTAL